MKTLLFIVCMLSCIFISGQTSLPVIKFPINNQALFSSNRERVWETLSNLPIEKSDWRYEDLRKNYLKKWQTEIFRTPIVYVNKITEPNTETPSMYYNATPDGMDSRIELDSSKFTPIDDQNRCVEHELGHAAFLGHLNVPGWLLYLGDITSKMSGKDNSMPYERIVMAAVLRRDIIDYFELPINAGITDKQLQDYIDNKSGKMDFGLKWLIETTKQGRLLPLVNFKNGYMVNEMLET